MGSDSAFTRLVSLGWRRHEKLGFASGNPAVCFVVADKFPTTTLSILAANMVSRHA